jgi:asparagine synthase (glutamine-hydrolysing)
MDRPVTEIESAAAPPSSDRRTLRFKGRFDPRGFDPAATPARPAETAAQWRRLRLPGVDLEWHVGFADVAMEDGVLALATGRARDSIASGTSGEARRWLERYAKRQLAAAEGVGGGFAVAIADLRLRRVMLLVDRFSIEPLCYAEDNDRIAFANSACDVIQAKLDPQSLYDYLYFHVIPSPQTAFRGVWRLPPAHRVVASAAGTDVKPYWQPQFIENDGHDLHGRQRQFVELVQDAVRTEADEPATACFLSGGTDSSTVAGMLTRLRGEPAHAYSIGFEAAGYDEMAYARIAATHFGLKHHEYYLTPDDLVEAIPRVAATLDQPFGNSSVLPAYFCALRAREDGFTRLLAGDGGDELFAGNARYATQATFELYHFLPPRLRAIVERPATKWPLFRSVPVLRQLGGYVRHARVPMPDRLQTFNLLRHLDNDALFEPAFRISIDPERPLEQQRVVWRSLNAASVVSRMLAYDWKFTLADNDLPKVRAAAALAGVSVGFPFLDRALTDFSLSIPPEWKLKRLKLRWFFKKALGDFLPNEVLRKKKHGFGLPFGPWLLRHAALRRLAEESLEAVGCRGIVRRDFTRKLLTERMREAPGYYGEMVWVLMMLEQWLRTSECDVVVDFG